MAKAKSSTSAAPKRRTVADLLRLREKVDPEFTPEQAEEVRKACEINDMAASNAERLSAKAVAELLRAEYGFAHGAVVLERMACKRFKRRSWAQR